MPDYQLNEFTLLRRKQVQALTGFPRSTLYHRITQRLWPKPVSLGARAVGWPAAEVQALNAARIAGCSDDDIRALVQRLEDDRIRIARGGVLGITEALCAEGVAK